MTQQMVFAQRCLAKKYLHVGAPLAIIPRMQRRTYLHISINFVITLVFVAMPLPVSADAALPDPPAQHAEAPVIITEVQAGSSTSASEEFIELYNTTSQAVDLSAGDWQLQIASSTATTWDAPLRTIPLSGIIAGGQHMIVASQYTSNSQTIQYLHTSAAQWFSSGISASAGHIRLIYTVDALQGDGSCVTAGMIADTVEWSTPQNGAATVPSITGRNVFVTPKTTGLPAGNSLVRLIDPVRQQYIDTNNDAQDFGLATIPTPAVANTGVAATSPDDSLWQVAAILPPELACTPNPLPQVDPSTPAPDPGGQSVLQPPVGSPPSDEGNGGSAGDLPPQSAPTGQAALPSIPVADSGLLGPQLSELLPNPASPQTDAADEFIELYNPNSVAFDLTGFSLSTGARTYIFPSGTLLAPDTFTAFFSVVTKLALPNSGGQVTLFDPVGGIVMQAMPYGVAKDGYAWVFISNAWQWTTTPTPSAPNKMAHPATTSKATVTNAKASTSPKTAKKAAAAKPIAKAGVVKSVSTRSSAIKPTAEVTADSPLHPMILAGVAALALLYGAYEYRTDLANRIHQFRKYRSARRAARASVKGR